MVDVTGIEPVTPCLKTAVKSEPSASSAFVERETQQSLWKRFRQVDPRSTAEKLRCILFVPAPIIMEGAYRVTGIDRRRKLRATNQNQPRSTKKPRTIVPPPQSARIMQRYVGGESIRQIAREERRDRATITKIVRSDEMQGFVQRMRERFYGFACDAMDAVDHSLKQQNDARLAYRMLSDIGIVPSAEERYSIAMQPPSIDKSTMTSLELAMAEGEDGRINRVAYGAACVIEESAKNFGTPLPTAADVHHLRRVAEVADEIARGRFHEICMSDGPEEKRIRELAERMVLREGGRKALPPRRTQRPLPHKKQTALVGQVSGKN